MRPWRSAIIYRIVLLGVFILMSNLRPFPVFAQADGGRSMIAFVKYDEENFDSILSLVDTDTGEVTDILNNGHFFYPVISPNGKHIAFLAESPQKLNTIYVIDTDGSNLRMLVDLKRTSAIVPKSRVVWAPDSSSLVYGVMTDRGFGKPDGFFRAALDGSSRERIAFAGITQPLYSSWIAGSPDGNQFAFLVRQEESIYPLIYIANADGTGARPVSTLLADERPPDEIAWSPDSQQTLLAGSRAFGNNPTPLLLGDAGGENAKSLIMPPPNYINSLSWSPDGSQIAFLAPQLQSNGIPLGDVFVANADGTGVRELNIPIEVSYYGTSWQMIPDNIVLPSAPISFLNTELKPIAGG